MKDYIIKLADHIIEILMVIISIILLVVVFTNVIFRYVIRSPLSWANEIARYGLVWWVFLGSTLAVEKDRHIALSFISKHLKLSINIIRKKIIHCLLIFYNIVLVYNTIKIFPKLYHQMTPFTRFPIAWMYAIILISALIMIIYSLNWLISKNK